MTASSGMATPIGACRGSALPFAHQNGAGSWKRRCGWLGRVGRTLTKRTDQQAVEFLGDRLGEPAVASFLPRVGNPERKNVTPQRPRWLTGKLTLPEYTQFGARQLFQVFNRDIHIAVVKYGGSSQWPGGIAGERA